MATPSLHEIAAMPFPASLNAMRKHYNPDWGKPVPEGAEFREFEVRVEYEYTVRETETVKVEAFSQEEAIEKAGDKLAEENRHAEEFDVIDARVVGAKGGDA